MDANGTSGPPKARQLEHHAGHRQAVGGGDRRAQHRERLAAQQPRQVIEEERKRCPADVGDRHEDEDDRPGARPRHRPPVATHPEIEQDHRREYLADDRERQEQPAQCHVPALDGGEPEHRDHDVQQLRVAHLQGVHRRQRRYGQRQQPQRSASSRRVEMSGHDDHPGDDQHGVQEEPDVPEREVVRSCGSESPRRQQEGGRILVGIDVERPDAARDQSTSGRILAQRVALDVPDIRRLRDARRRRPVGSGAGVPRHERTPGGDAPRRRRSGVGGEHRQADQHDRRGNRTDGRQHDEAARRPCAGTGNNRRAGSGVDQHGHLTRAHGTGRAPMPRRRRPPGARRRASAAPRTPAPARSASVPWSRCRSASRVPANPRSSG